MLSFVSQMFRNLSGSQLLVSLIFDILNFLWQVEPIPLFYYELMYCLIRPPMWLCETVSAKKGSFKFSLSLGLMTIPPLWWIIRGRNCDSNKHLPCSAVKVYSITVWGPRGRNIDQNITSREFIVGKFWKKARTFKEPNLCRVFLSKEWLNFHSVISHLFLTKWGLSVHITDNAEFSILCSLVVFYACLCTSEFSFVLYF